MTIFELITIKSVITNANPTRPLALPQHAIAYLVRRNPTRQTPLESPLSDTGCIYPVLLPIVAHSTLKAGLGEALTYTPSETLRKRDRKHQPSTLR